MYRRVFPRLFPAALFIGVLSVAVCPAAAQSPSTADAHQPAIPTTPADAPLQQHDMQHMSHDGGGSMPPSREGSGTAWQPDETPMYAFHREAAGWMLMAHGNGFLQYLHESGTRGSDQVGSINWVMGMADRPVATGHLGLRAMMSLEPWTIRGCGYPDLLASGEVCKGQAIHDRQHPHDLFMELAASYDRPLRGTIRVHVYGGPVGEPALGPVAFPHRLSAMPNPLAPITHHWFDATHITYGVVTAGISGSRWKAESSLFNGREPDDNRTNFDFGALDSWSGRLWFLPAKRWALQASAGHLTEAEAPPNAGGARVSVDRVTASATYHHVLASNGIWAITAGWGRNVEAGSDGTNALLAETNLTLEGRDAWFGRFELSQKTGHDLAIESPDLFTVFKLQAGYTRYLSAWNGLTPGIGASLSTAGVPEPLKSLYGSRVNIGLGVFVTLRPGQGGM
jgi:hypothetical protein